MSNQNLLEIKGLKVSYQADGKKVCAVNGVDLVLEKGETLGLVGETGAGKTTIAKATFGFCRSRRVIWTQERFL